MDEPRGTVAAHKTSVGSSPDRGASTEKGSGHKFPSQPETIDAGKGKSLLPWSLTMDINSTP